MEKQSAGIWIPIEIMEIQELCWTEKVLLALIFNLDNDKGCFATNEYFSKNLFVSKDRISKMVLTLIWGSDFLLTTLI